MKLIEKIALMQQEIGGLEKKSDNSYFKSKYVELNDVIEALRPLEEKHKVCITMPLSNVAGVPALSLVITDLETFEKIVEQMPLPAITDPQKMGSAITYYRRYQLMSFFNLMSLDDDGNSASAPASKPAYKASKPQTKTDSNVPDLEVDLIY